MTQPQCQFEELKPRILKLIDQHHYLLSQLGLVKRELDELAELKLDLLLSDPATSLEPPLACGSHLVEP